MPQTLATTEASAKASGAFPSGGASAPEPSRGSEILVETRDLSKVYRIYPSPWDRLWEAFGGSRRHRPFHALEGVDLSLVRGEGLAVIGENGAGKSTLLKILAGITTPSSGEVTVRGKVASILELGSGFHPDFTGRQNIVLNAAMLGLSDREVEERTPDIVEFSELGEFIDRPVKTYSTGMAMRLGFAIATQVDPDVLIIDEALSVGDGYFQKKCMDRMVRFLDEGGTLLFCSHAMYYVATFCRRALWLKAGRPAAFGPSEEVIQRYETFLVEKGRREKGQGQEGEAASAAETAADGATEGPAGARGTEPAEGGKPARLLSVRQMGERETGGFRHGDPWGLDIEWSAESPETPFHLAVGLDRVDDVQVVVFSTLHDGRKPFRGECSYRARLSVPELPLLRGTYSIQVYLMDEAALHVYDERKLRAALEVKSESYSVGLIEAPHDWRIAPTEDSKSDPPEHSNPGSAVAAAESP